MYGQESYKLTVQVRTEKNNALPRTDVFFDTTTKKTTDTKGEVHFTSTTGKHKVFVNHPNYQEKELVVTITNDQTVTVVLQRENHLEEVVITAKEDKGLTSKSVITRKAMEHLQPSSFSDLMELLPGGLSKDPNLNSINRVQIRESANAPGSYITSALGTQFMIDDNVWNTNANLLTSSDNGHMLYTDDAHNSTAIGVDMRTLSTNDIEKVEIIRGIPSAAYGDLTSGLIKIERKIGTTPLQARFKADGFSKQYYVGKGFEMDKNWFLNASIDLLEAKNDPTDQFENYQRLTASLRSKLHTSLWNNPLEWRSTMDISSNINTKEIDPDTGVTAIDKYKNTSLKISFTNNFIYTLADKNFFNKVTLNTAIRQGFDKIKQRKLINLSGPRSLPLSFEEGENVGFYPALRYIADFTTDSNPIDLSSVLTLNGTKKAGAFNFQYEAGLDWKYSVNTGNGMQWDMETPPNAVMGQRPRTFKEIPAWQNGAAFIGNQLSYNLGEHKFNLYTGFRFSKLLGVDSSYKISTESYFEPRANLQYSLPNIRINGNPLKIDFTAGYGEFYKTPTLMMLYPNRKFWDYTQLNYFHNDTNYRYVNLMTYIQNVENKDLVAAKNIKKEIRVDLSFKSHNLFVTYFNENLQNGFREENRTVSHTYKVYDANYVDHNDWNNGPNLEVIPYTLKNEFATYSFVENGSATVKKGIEFGYTSPRFKAINTRFTLTGAWFQTQYRNTVPVHERPTISLGGQSFPYFGIYANDIGYINENANYNLFIDTYLPRLGLTVSASLQGVVYEYQKRDHRIAAPTSYYGLDGIVHNFEPGDENDPYLQWLIRNVSVSDNTALRTTYTFRANLKITKEIYKGIRSSMFVNRLFNYQHPYYNLGTKVYRKSGNTPYFGMELTYNF